MFFTRTGRIVAWLAIIWGALRIFIAVAVIQSGDPRTGPEIIGSSAPGHAIDQGIYAIIFGILVGILTDISRSVASTIGTKSGKRGI